jgi:DMSO/TMAO reductase YedYZ molybdopterin-dependent catalytic subunit
VAVRRADIRRFLVGAVAGLVALLVFLGVAEIVAIATGPESAPSIAIGQSAIAHTPESLKAFAITHFGESDKSALLAGIYAVLSLLAVVAGGMAALTRRWVGLAAIAALGIVSAVSAARYPVAGQLAIVPSLAGAALAVWAFAALVHDRPAPAHASGALTRRRVLAMGGGYAVFGGVAYVVGRIGLQSAFNAVASRNAIRLPTAQGTSPQIGTGFDVAGLSTYITPTADFYRVDTALVVPELQTAGYRLRLHGMVDRPMSLSFQDILAMPQVERAVTLTCVSDPVGGPYIGTARWLGTLLTPILQRAGVSPEADQLFLTSADGMTIGADLQAAMDGRDSMLVIGMNGEPLPFEHGFPVRMVIPGFYGYVSACKWLVDMEVTTYDARQAYWVPRGYSARAPIKVESRIDTPGQGARLAAGTVTVAGVAWHQHVGIAKVEVSVDHAAWQAADLAAVESADTWRLWRYDWLATTGSHVLAVRATDSDGVVQASQPAGVVPNGATGYDAIRVSVG